MPICRIVKEPEDLAALTTVLRSNKMVQAAIRRAPHLGKLVRVIFGSSADLTGGKVGSAELARGLIGHARIVEERATAATASLATLIQKPIADVFKIADDGLVDMVRAKGRKTMRVGINDIIENHRAYKLTPDQLESVQHRLDLKRDFVDYYNRFADKKLTRGEGQFPRRVGGLKDKKGVVHPTRGDETPAAAPSRKMRETGRFGTARAEHANGKVKTQTEMIAEGFQYRNPDEVLQEWAHEISKSTADAQFIRWAEKNLGKKGTGQLQKKSAIVGKKTKTGVFPVQPAEKFGGKKGEMLNVSKFESEKVPGLGEYYAPDDVVKYMTDLLEKPPRFEIPLASRLADESRTAIASFDASVVGIQLLVGALGSDLGHLLVAGVTRNPKRLTSIFPKAVYGAIAGLFDAGLPDRYFTDNLDFINRWSPYLGGLRSSDYFDVLKRTSPNEPRIMKAVHGAQRPFGRAFEFALDMAKIEQLKSWERIMKASGTKITSDMKEAMGAWARNSVGATSVKGLGMSNKQLAIEGTFLWFSQRYTRSLFATAGTLLETGVAGHEARLAFGGLATAGLIVYVAAAEGLGQKPNLDPRKPGFMSIRVGDQWIGIGGGYRALTKAMISTVKSAKDSPEDFLKADFDNPLFSFWRSRTTPLTGGVLEIWSGKEFNGKPIEGVADWGPLLARRFAPFNVQAAFDARGGGVMDMTTSAVASSLGLGPQPMTERQKYDWFLKEVEMADGSQRFPDGVDTVHTDKNNFTNFTRTDPEANRMREDYQESRLNRGKEGRAIQEALNLRMERLDAAGEELAQTGDYRKYRGNVNTIRGETRASMEFMNLDFVPQTEDKKIVSTWYDLYDDPRAIDQITGGVDSEGLEEAQDEWKSANPGAYEELIEPSETIGETEMETELRTDRKVISEGGWWDTAERTWDSIVEVLESRGNDMLNGYTDYADYIFKKRKELEEYYIGRGVDPSMAILRADIQLRKDPVIKKYQKLHTRERLLLQRDNPQLVFLLQKWGYSTTSLLEYKIANASLQSDGLVQ